MNRDSLLSRQSRRRFITVALAVIMAGVAAPSAVAQDVLHARVSFDSGGAMVKGSADEDWSYATTNTLVMPGDTLWVDEEGTLEVEMSGGTFLRMADGSKADVVSLPPSGVIQGWTGAFYVQRIARSTGSVIFETPVAAVHVQGDTQVRFDILSNGATTVGVRWGAVTIRTPGAQDTVVQTGQRSYIDPGYLPSLPEPFDRGEEDSFDAWNRERARLLAVGYDAVPTTIIKEAPVGVADLSTYGEWVTIENDYYWRPTVVTEYIPYRYGHWSFVPSIGYSWVGDYPFGYVTSHYGRWRHHPSYGWCWGYRPGWSPAWVASVRYGSNFVWSPLDPWDRPVVFGNDFYYVGGLQFSVFASSYVHSDYLLYGGRYINPFTSRIAYGVPSTQINIWNININTRRPHFPYPDRSIPVRDYSPRRVIRGPVSLEREGTLARSRVTNLESRVGRQRFTPSDATVRRSVRTTAQPSTREARARSVRLAPEAASPTPDVRGRRLATTDIGGIRSRGRDRDMDRSPSAPGEGVSPRSTAPSRGRTTAPDAGGQPDGRGRTDGGRSIRQAPDAGPSVPSERSRGSAGRSIRGGETRTAPEAPSVRGRSDGGGAVRERSMGEPGRVRTSEPSRGRSETPSVRTPSRSTPSPQSSVESPRSAPPSVRTSPGPSPRSVEAPRSAPPSVRTSPGPSPRSVEAPRSAPPSVRTTPSPSRGRASVRVAPQSPPSSRVIGRSSGPSVRTAPSPRAQAPSPTLRSAPSPQVSRPQMSRPSQPSMRQAPSAPSPRMSAPSPRVSAPSGGGGRMSAPSGGGTSRGSIGGGGGNRGNIGGGGGGGRSIRGRSR